MIQLWLSYDILWQVKLDVPGGVPDASAELSGAFRREFFCSGHADMSLRPIHLYTDDIDDNTKQQLINLSSLCLDAVFVAVQLTIQLTVPDSGSEVVELLLVS